MNNVANEPLASRMRPNNIDEIISQQHLVGEKGIIRRMVKTRQLSSMIFYGPPGIERRVSPRRLREVQNINLDS